MIYSAPVRQPLPLLTSGDRIRGPLYIPRGADRKRVKLHCVSMLHSVSCICVIKKSLVYVSSMLCGSEVLLSVMYKSHYSPYRYLSCSAIIGHAIHVVEYAICSITDWEDRREYKLKNVYNAFLHTTHFLPTPHIKIVMFLEGRYLLLQYQTQSSLPTIISTLLYSQSSLLYSVLL